MLSPYLMVLLVTEDILFSIIYAMVGAVVVFNLARVSVGVPTTGCLIHIGHRDRPGVDDCTYIRGFIYKCLSLRIPAARRRGGFTRQGVSGRTPQPRTFSLIFPRFCFSWVYLGLSSHWH